MPPFINSLPYAAPLEDTMAKMVNTDNIDNMDTDNEQYAETVYERGLALERQRYQTAAAALYYLAVDHDTSFSAAELNDRAGQIDRRLDRIKRNREAQQAVAREVKASAERDAASMETARRSHVVRRCLSPNTVVNDLSRAIVYEAVRVDVLDRHDQGVQHQEWPDGLNADDVRRVAKWVEGMSCSDGVLNAAARIIRALR